MERIHGPVVAGTFYPADAARLRAEIRSLLAAASPPPVMGQVVGLIVPHAGIVYSGKVAATAFALLRGRRVDRVLVIGPSHYSWFAGAAALPADGWRTPLGLVRLEPPSANSLIRENAVAYAAEHSLEVELPFIQEVAPDATVTPLLFGDVDATAGGLLLDDILDDGDVLVVSSDLSHYLPQPEAETKDAETAQAVLAGEFATLGPDAACGFAGVGAALALAQIRRWDVELLDLGTSADTAGNPHRVVGYGAFAFVGYHSPG